MSKTATLVWIDPTTKFTAIEVAMRVAGAPEFTVISTVQPGVQKSLIPDLVDGDYEFMVTALNGTLRSAGKSVTGSVVTPPVEVAPADVTGLAVTFA